jgi:hypothetical protein
MKFGMVLISNAYTPARAEIIKQSFNSLTKTDVQGLERPRMTLMAHASGFDYKSYIELWSVKWDVEMEPDTAIGLNALVSATAEKLIQHEDVTHLIFMYDDFIYNPQWMRQLENLIWRHPEAKAWSVYRSSYERHHKILSTDESTGDVIMSMHDGLGCMTVEEWRAYGAYGRTDFTCPIELGGGNTIDIYHAASRPGERWATGRDYWENLGVHAYLGRRDMAVDFVGEQ